MTNVDLEAQTIDLQSLDGMHTGLRLDPERQYFAGGVQQDFQTFINRINGLVCNTNPVGALPTIRSLFAYDGSDQPTTTSLVVVFSEPVEIANVSGVKVTRADGVVRTSIGAALFDEDWGQAPGEYWTFAMDGGLDNGSNDDGSHTVQTNTACNTAGDGNAFSQAG